MVDTMVLCPDPFSDLKHPFLIFWQHGLLQLTTVPLAGSCLSHRSHLADRRHGRLNSMWGKSKGPIQLHVPCRMFWGFSCNLSASFSLPKSAFITFFQVLSPETIPQQASCMQLSIRVSFQGSYSKWLRGPAKFMESTPSQTFLAES